MEFKKLIKFRPAFDKRSNQPNKDYGIGALTISFVLIGDGNAVSFTFSTGIYTEDVRRELQEKYKCADYNPFEPMGYDVSYHSSEPKYEGQSKTECEFTGLGYCYCDGSGIKAEKYMNVLIEDGEESVWKMLEDYYYDVFGE